MTCALFTYIYQRLYDNRDPKFVHYTIDGNFYKYKYANNYNKFLDFFNYITADPTSFLYNREKYIETFCYIQKIYHAFIKFKNICRFKYCKKFDLDQDLIGNDLKDIKSNYKIKIIENNTVYELSIRDILKNIFLSLTNNAEYFFEPKKPINPFTGLELSNQNLYNIYFAYKHTSLKIQIPFEYYFICGFDMRNYKKYSEGLVNKDIIQVNVRNMDNDSLMMNINRMFRDYGFKKLYFSDEFPNERIREIFTPYVELFMYIKFGQDQNRVFWSKKLLKQQMNRFVKYKREHNPGFGRVIRVSNKRETMTGKRSYKRVVQDDHVRWDPHFPYIRENKEPNDTSIFGSLQSNTANLNSTLPSDISSESEDSDDEPDTQFNSFRNFSYMSSFQQVSRTASLESDIDTAYNSLATPSIIGRTIDYISNNDISNNDISNNINNIDNDDSLTSYINNNSNTINEIHSNIVANSILTRLIQIRMTNLNDSPDTIFSLLDGLIKNQIKIIAGKLLVKYLSNRLTDEMRERITNDITGNNSEPILNDVVTNLQSFYDNISLISNNDLSNNDL
jgi:hypothetical protein